MECLCNASIVIEKRFGCLDVRVSKHASQQVQIPSVSEVCPGEAARREE
jgi:hypothetical protein